MVNKTLQYCMGRKISPIRLATSTSNTHMEKEGQQRECETFRGIELLSHAGKVNEKLLEQSARPIRVKQSPIWFLKKQWTQTHYSNSDRHTNEIPNIVSIRVTYLLMKKKEA
jgi:hypothetical protein